MNHEELLIHSRALFYLERNFEAIEILETLVKHGNARAMNDLAVFLIKTGGQDPAPSERAVQLLTSAIELGHSEASLNLAQFRRRQRKREQAEILFNEALYNGQTGAAEFLLEGIPDPDRKLHRLISETSHTHNQNDLYLLARSFREKGKFISAKFCFQKAFEAGNTQALEELADMYRRDMKDWSQFNELVTSLRKETPYLAHLIQGQAHLDKRETTRAISQFTAALQDNPQSTAALKKILQCHKTPFQILTFEHWVTDIQNLELWNLLLVISNELNSQGQLQQAKYWRKLWLITQSKSQKRKIQDKNSPVTEEISAKNPSEQMRPISEPVIDIDSAVKIDANFETWIIHAETQMSASYISRNSYFLKTLFNLNRKLCPIIDNWMGCHVTEDWLDEILAKYEDQRSIQRIEPVWPIRFESDELQIILSVEGLWLRAWVGRNNMGGIIAVRLSDFDIQTALRGEDQIFAVGVAVSFFLDRTINLDSNGHPHFLQNVDGSVNPTSQFDLDIHKTWSGQRHAMKSHMVSGHPRTLPEGQTASLEALARSPIYVRRNLKPNQTFVRGHQRNGPVLADTVIRYLRSSSNLADAIGAFR